MMAVKDKVVTVDKVTIGVLVKRAFDVQWHGLCSLVMT
jgi:hypothetical protein